MRNDLLGSQNTIHPSDDRVYSIRELMMLMSIPQEFRWVDMSLEELNALSDEKKCAMKYATKQISVPAKVNQ